MARTHLEDMRAKLAMKFEAPVSELRDRTERAEARMKELGAERDQPKAKLSAIDAGRVKEPPAPEWPSEGCCRAHPHEPQPGVCDGSIFRSIEKHQKYTRDLMSWQGWVWDTVASLRMEVDELKGSIMNHHGLNMQPVSIDDMPPSNQRVMGFYWVKKRGESGWVIAEFCARWWILGWWLTGDKSAFYDKDIDMVVGPINPPQCTWAMEIMQ